MAGTRIPYACALTVLREQSLLREGSCNKYFLSETFRLIHEEFSNPTVDMSQWIDCQRHCDQNPDLPKTSRAPNVPTYPELR